MSLRNSIRYVCVLALVASAAACSDAPTSPGPWRKTRHDGPMPLKAKVIDSNTITANGVSSSPSGRGVGTSP